MCLFIYLLIYLFICLFAYKARLSIVTITCFHITWKQNVYEHLFVSWPCYLKHIRSNRARILGELCAPEEEQAANTSNAILLAANYK